MLVFYDLGDLQEARWINRGFANDNWKAETDQGRYFLKRRHLSMRQPRVISAQHDLMRWLGRVSFPAPQVIQDKAGSTFVTVASRVREVPHFIEGDLVDLDRPEHLNAAARALRCYHAGVVGFSSSVLWELGSLCSPAVASAALAHLEEAWDLHQHRRLARTARQLRRYTAAMGARFERYGALLEVLIGRHSLDAYGQEIGPTLGLHMAEEIAAFRHRYFAEAEIGAGVRDLIRRLCGRYKLAVLSNSPPGLERWLADWDILHHPNVVGCSGDAGVVKPDPAIFHLALGRLDVEPKGAVFIDDSPGYVMAARGLGLRAIHCTTPEALERDLGSVLHEAED